MLIVEVLFVLMSRMCMTTFLNIHTLVLISDVFFQVSVTCLCAAAGDWPAW